MGNENTMRANRLRATSCEYKKKTRVVKGSDNNMPKTRARRTRRRKRRQRGGLLPLTALIPALIAGGGGRPWRWVRRVVRLVTAPKKGWERPFGKKDDDGTKRGSREAQTKFCP